MLWWALKVILELKHGGWKGARIVNRGRVFLKEGKANTKVQAAEY